MGFAGSHGNSIFNFLRNMKSYFYKKNVELIFTCDFQLEIRQESLGEKLGLKVCLGVLCSPELGCRVNWNS